MRHAPCHALPCPAQQHGEPCSSSQLPANLAPGVQAAASGRCGSAYVQRGGYCRSSCGVCQAEGAAGVQSGCDDQPTPDGVTCMVRKGRLGK